MLSPAVADQKQCATDKRVFNENNRAFMFLLDSEEIQKKK